MSFSVPELQRRLHRVRGRQGRRVSLTTILPTSAPSRFVWQEAMLKQFLTPAHKAARRQWVRVYLRWTRHQWQQVLFSDETLIYLRSKDGGCSRVFRRRGERHAANCIQSVVPYQGVSIMVWGGISHHGKTDFVINDGNLNARRYVDEVLDPDVVPFAQRIDAGFILQHDNAHPHTAYPELPSRTGLPSFTLANMLPWPQPHRRFVVCPQTEDPQKNGP